MPNNMPYFIGNTPWHKEDCNVASMIDDIRIYDKVIDIVLTKSDPTGNQSITKSEHGSFTLNGTEPITIDWG